MPLFFMNPSGFYYNGICLNKRRVMILDKIESKRKEIVGMEGHYLCLDESQDNRRIRKTDCWEIIKIYPELNRVYLKKIGRKVMTERPLDELEKTAILITKKEFKNL